MSWFFVVLLIGSALDFGLGLGVLAAWFFVPEYFTILALIHAAVSAELAITLATTYFWILVSINNR